MRVGPDRPAGREDDQESVQGVSTKSVLFAERAFGLRGPAEKMTDFVLIPYPALDVGRGPLPGTLRAMTAVRKELDRLRGAIAARLGTRRGALAEAARLDDEHHIKVVGNHYTAIAHFAFILTHMMTQLDSSRSSVGVSK